MFPVSWVEYINEYIAFACKNYRYHQHPFEHSLLVCHFSFSRIQTHIHLCWVSSLEVLLLMPNIRTAKGWLGVTFLKLTKLDFAPKWLHSIPVLQDYLKTLQPGVFGACDVAHISYFLLKNSFRTVKTHTAQHSTGNASDSVKSMNAHTAQTGICDSL